MTKELSIKDIDVNFDFTTDTPHYWDNYWDYDKILGHFNADPDAFSKTMQLYHKLIYSRKLPNGETLMLQSGSGAKYLTWNNYRFGSDSIIVSFRYKKYRHMIEQVANSMPNWQEYVESYIRKSYTIGGEIIFPKCQGGINQSRGCNPYICDRWDLTLECIRKYYLSEENPLFDVLNKNKEFFDLFVDFKGYIDFFFLQDCVSQDYKSVIFWIGNGEFQKNPFPKTVAEYLEWIDKELKFVELRNKRIECYCQAQ